MAAIDHVIVLVLENRSFDHMLGFLDHPGDDFDGLAGGAYTNPGWRGEPGIAASPKAKTVLPVGPGHSHAAVMEQLALQNVDGHLEPTNVGFVRSLERTGRGLEPPSYAGLLGGVANWLKGSFGKHNPTAMGRGPLAMLCQSSDHVPVLSTLALQFAVCTRWFCSVPGETWPNRNFLHAATSDGETDIDIRFYGDSTIFEKLEEWGRDWHIYFDDTPQVWAFRKLWDTPSRHAKWYRFAEFAKHVAAGQLPAYSFIEPNHRPALHLMGGDEEADSADLSNNQHPENNLVADNEYDTATSSGVGNFARAEQLIATVYEALRANQSLFERSLLLITYDEHGGLYDHVPPQTGVPSPGSHPDVGVRLWHRILRRKAASFDFTMLGPRVPAIVISPFVPAGLVNAGIRDHASVPATLRRLFGPSGATPLSPRDDWAPPFHLLARLERPRRDDLPDLSSYALPPVQPASDQQPIPSQVTTPTVTASGPTRMPAYYGSFVEQAEKVHQRLVSVGEPEAGAVQGVNPGDRARQITEIFATAAERHRRERHLDQAS